MAARHVVVDGSNLATEGRSMPSLAQLDQAVREFLLENPEDVVTVVVDASFGHRIDQSESDIFEDAEAAGELVSPPAGAIGRGDAFLLRIADKTGATVLSNDSFQEFHGDYEWLFERGRLIGGKPVPGVGWIFTPRTPVRGPRSREAVKEAKRKTKGEGDSAVPGLDLAASRSKGKSRGKVERAIAVALEEAVAPKDKPGRRRKSGSPPADPVNDPLTFITFIAAHPLGGEVVATVESFASHGAFVDCEGARCYLPLSAMGDPPPKSAREIFSKGEQVRFVVQALDPQRRGVELAMPGFAKIAGAPTEETVAAEIEAHTAEGAAGTPDAGAPDVGAPVRRTRKKAAPAPAAAAPVLGEEPPVPDVAVKKAAPRRRTARMAEIPPAEAVVVPEAPVKKAAPRRRAAQVAQTPPAEAEAPVKKAAPRRRGARVDVTPPVEVEAVVPEAPVKKAAPRRRAAQVAQTPPPEAEAPVKKAAPRRRAALVAVSPPAEAEAPVKKAAPRRRAARVEVTPPVEAVVAPELRTRAAPARPVAAADLATAPTRTRASRAAAGPAPEETSPAPAPRRPRSGAAKAAPATAQPANEDGGGAAAPPTVRRSRTAPRAPAAESSPAPAPVPRPRRATTKKSPSPSGTPTSS